MLATPILLGIAVSLGVVAFWLRLRADHYKRPAVEILLPGEIALPPEEMARQYRLKIQRHIDFLRSCFMIFFAAACLSLVFA